MLRGTRKRTKLPAARRGWTGVLWFLFGVALCAVLGGGVWMAVNPVKTPSSQSFAAVLRPAATPVGVDLLQDAMLEALLVSEGEYVRQGQSLALLKTDAMAQRIVEVRTNLTALRYERSCLIAQGEASFLDSLDQWVAEQHASDDLESALHVARAQCAARLKDNVHLAEVLEARVAQMHERRSLLKAHVQANRQMEARPTTQTETRTTKALESLLKINALDREIAIAEADQAAHIRQSDRAHITQIEALNVEIKQEKERLARLESLVASPRITAPVGGVVTRVRDPGPGHSGYAPLRIVEIARAGGDRFVLEMQAQPGALGAVQEGLTVDVLVSGIPGLPKLQGHLQKPDIEAAPTGQAGTTFWVALKPDSQRQVEQTAFARSGSAMSAHAMVALQPQNFGAHIKRDAWALVNSWAPRHRVAAMLGMDQSPDVAAALDWDAVGPSGL